ncbi:hypothetical protein LOAG_04031 [Loa loa]|uniref:Uncharacterized protein n=1 Tax=Loa loa TaxID=7209 RepID=A0A1S0U3T0_LOALO|nr:hypothetical protein LOAG_04031 [Loa loa]EFO24455.1 hypothetical protein LOAG_04031 [Loa loa]
MDRNVVGNNQKILSSPFTCYSTMSRPSSKCLPKSGSSDKEVSQIHDSANVEKEHLASICIHLCDQLRTIINLLMDFAADVCVESTNARSLLCELEDKVLPFLVNLDIEMTASEKLIRTNIDTARISETKVDWLLKFNKCKLEMREMLVTLSDVVYEDLERVLSLRCRGCCGINFKQDLMICLRQMKKSTDKLQKQIKLEQTILTY